MTMIAPCLNPNGTIGLCSPSRVAKYEEYQITIAAMCSRGFRVKEADNLYKDTYGYLASPQERAADFNQLIADPEVELVLFSGGEGSNELLPYIDFENIKRHPKRICSFSDGTTILDTIWAQTGLEVYYGQSPRLFEDFQSYDQEHFQNHLIRGNAETHTAGSVWRPQTYGKAEGILIGGYARNFAMLLGSRYFPIDLSKKYVLFLEDHEMFGDVSYVSAMISHIEQHDLIHSVAGLIFGHYSEQLYPELLDRLRRLGEQYQIPAVYCDDFGHGRNHAILPVGHRAELDTEKGTLRYL